jgi:endonuclease G
MSKKFGKFSSLSAFLESYKAAEKRELLKAAVAKAPAISAEEIKKLQKQKRNVVEVNANLRVRESDDLDNNGGKPYRLRIQVTKILANATEVSTDLKDAQKTGRDIFLAIRFGDAMGIHDKIKGLTAKAQLHLKREWITKEKTHDHGGEKMSVLHFTHHPLGFICTEVKCYA